jgi:hypothetical protein
MGHYWSMSGPDFVPPGDRSDGRWPSQPPPGQPWQMPPTPNTSGGSLLLGLVIGVIVLLGGGWTFLAFVTRFNGDVGFGLAVGLLVAYIVVAIVFAVRPSTSRLGAGLLLAIGAVLVILAGLCFGLVFGVIR